MASTNRLLKALRRLGASNAELESEARQRVVEEAGANPISEVKDRQFARMRGSIAILSMKPRGGTPWLEAEFTDGSGTVTLIWMGRRSIPGIAAGQELIVSGRVSFVDGERRLYNPFYELVAA
ncbi:ATP-dependent DNA helicase RecG [Propionicimonas paludicola]|uniref:ATP-dependent DNA helicase RecG n=1 Tax=Propionicimonas paludicola TaxID=185243 RepID=A0A2A9CR62_9ACTN|nr:OB-fold nucleic acid binding domain-containing protein [Propionicimonas paludicola]PFG16606.1 ATP-dependent DNA helicase RecG [Propionicimonas paludicola]